MTFTVTVPLRVTKPGLSDAVLVPGLAMLLNSIVQPLLVPSVSAEGDHWLEPDVVTPSAAPFATLADPVTDVCAELTTSLPALTVVEPV